MDEPGEDKRQNLEEEGLNALNNTDPGSQGNVDLDSSNGMLNDGLLTVKEPNTAQLQELIREHVGFNHDKFQTMRILLSQNLQLDENMFSQTWDRMEEEEPLLFKNYYKRKFHGEQHDILPKKCSDSPEGGGANLIQANTQKRQKVDKDRPTSIEQVEVASVEENQLLSAAAADIARKHQQLVQSSYSLWNEQQKQIYVKHSERGYNIHKTLAHRHIVRLWDMLKIDRNTCCTVLEYCSGNDLEAVLKATPFLLEEEARIIAVQISEGLVYLNKRSQKIIHYDLKPGNVLFDEYGVAKVSDFGLSKIVEDNVGSQGMELTSQGAGTYWYLPPECFELSRTPLISSKVDVWSLGVLLYQMLFGRRPFGHDQSQERILREQTIIKARKVEFPASPSVSHEAKEFIRRCLTYNQAERPDVLAIAQDPYLNYTKK